MLRGYSSWSILLATAMVVAVADQTTKSLASNHLGPESDRTSIPIVGSILQLRYVENTGAAFGMFQENTSILIVLSILIVIVLGYLFRALIASSSLLGVAFGLQFGGATGNLIDRIRLGYVVDFIDVPNFPTFNVADSGITVGVTLLAYVLLFHPDPTNVGDEESDAPGQTDESTEATPDQPAVRSSSQGSE